MSGVIYTTDREPNITGTVAKAWLQDVESLKVLHPEINTEGCVKSYVVEAPTYHLFWNHYLISLVSLKPIVGVEDALIMLDGATHEVIVAVLNPEFPVAINSLLSLLHPLNYTGQIIAETDAEAIARFDSAVDEVVNGKLSPDTDYISMWVERFGDSNLIKGSYIHED